MIYILPTDLPLVLGQHFDDYEQYIIAERAILKEFNYEVFSLWNGYLSTRKSEEES